MYTKYRAKAVEDHRWVYGCMQETPEGYFIVCNNGIKEVVDKSTVGICINYTDSDKVDIYSGDVVEFNGHNEQFLVWFCNEMQCLVPVLLDSSAYFNGYDYANGDCRLSFEEFCLMLQDPYGDFQYGGIHVVGNVYDNPSLFECVDYETFNIKDQVAIKESEF